MASKSCIADETCDVQIENQPIDTPEKVSPSTKYNIHGFGSRACANTMLAMKRQAHPCTWFSQIAMTATIPRNLKL
jgi:hypothetical protein